MSEVFAILVLLAVLVIGMAGLYVNMKRLVRTEVDEMRTMLYAHIEREKEKLAAIAAEAAKAVKTAAVPATPVAAASVAQPPKPEPKPAAAPVKETKAKDEIPEEILLVISAAVAAFLGPAVRVRSARMIQTGSSAWAQQGRVFVQASHNLPMAHHAHA